MSLHSGEPRHRLRRRQLRLRTTAAVFAVLVAVLAGSGRLIGLEKPEATQPENLSKAPLGLIAGEPGPLTCLEPRRCSGFLAGSDGTALDTDLVLPDAGHYPLVVQVHGWGSNKGTGDPTTTYTGDRFLTDRGYAVLRYSARGFGRSWGQTELGASDREIADLRTLVSTIVDDSRFGILPDRIAVMGRSYGGHHAWAAAATRPAWATPEGRAVRSQRWSRSRDGPTSGPPCSPTARSPTCGRRSARPNSPTCSH